jgi:hypothetical protein
VAETTAKKQQNRGCGRPFAKGKSGNPKGRPVGSRNKATILAEGLLAGEAGALTRKAISLAKKGDPTALRLCMERLLSPVKGRPVSLELPPVETVQDVLRAQAAVISAMATGQITIDEAATVTEVLEVRRRMLEMVDMERRLVALEAHKHEAALAALDDLDDEEEK